MKTIGKYSIVKQVGAGAMGKVYQALDPDMNRQVALKVIKWSDTDDDAGRQNKKARLLKDARNAGSLLHPNIIAVYGFEQEGDTPFIVMEFVNGPTLKGVLLGKDGKLDPKSVTRYLRQAADALDYAHRKGIIHRDIKPDNIMISEEDNVKIADFGISKVVTGQTSGHTLTQAGMVLGTPHYMSPEQVQGLTLDGRSDLFSLAVVAYQMLTAHRPFEAEEITAILYKIAFEEPERPELVNPALGSGVGKVLMRAPGEAVRQPLLHLRGVRRGTGARLDRRPGRRLLRALDAHRLRAQPGDAGAQRARRVAEVVAGIDLAGRGRPSAETGGGRGQVGRRSRPEPAHVPAQPDHRRRRRLAHSGRLAVLRASSS